MARAVLCILAMAALCAAPSATGASTASAKWTSRYTRLGTETKSLFGDDEGSLLRRLVPVGKNNGHVFGTHCKL